MPWQNFSYLGVIFSPRLETKLKKLASGHQVVYRQDQVAVRPHGQLPGQGVVSVAAPDDRLVGGAVVDLGSILLIRFGRILRTMF
jgi:hypothetical protein